MGASKNKDILKKVLDFAMSVSLLLLFLKQYIINMFWLKIVQILHFAIKKKKKIFIVNYNVFLIKI